MHAENHQSNAASHSSGHGDGLACLQARTVRRRLHSLCTMVALGRRSATILLCEGSLCLDVIARAHASRSNMRTDG